MADSLVFLGNNISLRVIQVGDSYALATKQLTVGSAMAAGDISASIFGINKPIRLVKLTDGSFALATATAVTPRPGADLVVSIFGNNIGIRLVALGDGTYALATAAQ